MHDLGGVRRAARGASVAVRSNIRRKRRCLADAGPGGRNPVGNVPTLSLDKAW